MTILSVVQDLLDRFLTKWNLVHTLQCYTQVYKQGFTAVMFYFDVSVVNEMDCDWIALWEMLSILLFRETIRFSYTSTPTLHFCFATSTIVREMYQILFDKVIKYHLIINSVCESFQCRRAPADGNGVQRSLQRFDGWTSHRPAVLLRLPGECTNTCTQTHIIPLILHTNRFLSPSWTLR